MKEGIQKHSDEVSIVIYDAPLPPKYFKLTKRFIKNIFVLVPIFIFIIIVGFFFWGLGIRVKESPAPKMPTTTSESDIKILNLESELRNLQASNNALTDKLSQLNSETKAEDPFLIAIRKPYGMQNLLSENKVALDQFEFTQDSKKSSLKFQIISSTPEKKVTGHVIVFMISDSGILAYPLEANKTIQSGIKYSSGESFAVSRLRPTNAEFPPQVHSDSFKFIIYIFSREGDLLLIKETESFKIGNK